MFYGVQLSVVDVCNCAELAFMSVYDFLNFGWAMLFWGCSLGVFCAGLFLLPKWK